MRLFSDLNFKNLSRFKQDFYFDYKEQLIFLFTSIILPIFFNFFIFLTSLFYKNQNFQFVIKFIDSYIIKFFLPLTGFIILSIKNFKLLVKSRLILYYVWEILFPVIQLFLYRLLLLFTKDQNYLKIFELILFTFSVALISFFFFWKNNYVKKMFLRNIKNYFVVAIILVSIGLFVYVIFSLYFQRIQLLIDSSLPSNQKALIGGNRNNFLNSKILIINLFISSIILAPIIEEIIYRYIVQTATNNKVWSIFISILFFAFVHIRNSYDWQHVFSYLALGTVAGTIFYFYKNLFALIALHSFANIIAFVSIFIGR